MLRWWSCKDLLPKRIMLNQLALFISLASDVKYYFWSWLIKNEKNTSKEITPLNGSWNFFTCTSCNRALVIKKQFTELLILHFVLLLKHISVLWLASLNIGASWTSQRCLILHSQKLIIQKLKHDGLIYRNHLLLLTMTYQGQEIYKT